MTTRPTRIAQTTREAKRDYKKHGPQISERQQRQLERGAQLDERAAKFREQEERKRIAKQKREDRERKEKGARKQQGVGLATQLVGYNHTQAKLKSGMEAFLGLQKQQEEKKRMDAQIKQKMQAIAETVEKEPWDDADADDLALDESPDLGVVERDSLMDDDLDDDTLLEAHDLIMSDTVEEVLEPSPEPQPARPPQKPAPPKPVVSGEDIRFLRLHGPVNKSIENILGKLPEPLIELLSTDNASNQPNWNPPISMLHKLNPVGLPPHRLRLKVGCTVTLLRDLNTSSQLSKSSHLQIVRTEKEQLECLVLDGQLKGTKTILTRVPFGAKYRNEDQSPFQRLQFPIRVSTDYTPPALQRDTSQYVFKIPSISERSLKRTDSSKKPTIPLPKAQPKVNPSSIFKLPGLPAFRWTKQLPRNSVTTLAPDTLLDVWDDFLASGTQLAREISSDGIDFQSKPFAQPGAGIPTVSTQDLDFTLDDLEELALSQSVPLKPAAIVANVQKQSAKDLAPPKTATKPAMAPPPPKAAPQTNLKRKAPLAPLRPAPPKKAAIQTRAPVALAKVEAPSRSFGSFSQLGLSTQDAVSFFDDDEFSNSSPPIAV